VDQDKALATIADFTNDNDIVFDTVVEDTNTGKNSSLRIHFGVLLNLIFLIANKYYVPNTDQESEEECCEVCFWVR
jgi:hypothetical protein